MRFVARAPELTKLKEVHRRQRSSFVVIYGRRRIGKTEMVRHFSSNSSAEYLEFAGRLDQKKDQQIQSFLTELARMAPDLQIGSVDSWQGVFHLLQDHIKQLPSGRNVILFLDEVPWMDSQKSGFLGELSAFWNGFCTTRSNIRLIVCGSAASYMLKKIVSDTGPMHGRITDKIGMEQFNLHATRELLVANGWSLSNKSITDIYTAVGGVAKYLISLNPGLTPSQAIQELCFSKNALLKTEYKDLFHSLFKNATTHYAIMDVLASRWQGLSQTEIMKKAKISRGAVSSALEELIASGFVEERPFFGKQKRNGMYVASDMFCYFHKKWMSGTIPKDWGEISTNQTYRSWAGFAFEKICHLHVNQIKQALGISGVPTSTHYWSYKPENSDERGVQIDLLIKHENRSRDIELVECKYYDGEFVISKSYRDELINKRNSFNQKTNNRYNVRLVLCASEGVNQNEHFNELNPKVVTLEDLFAP